MNNQKYYLEYLKKTGCFPQSVYHRAKHDMVRKMFSSVSAGSLVLDAGCGIGHITGSYCDAYSIVGIDEQRSAVQCCSCAHHGTYIQAKLNMLPFSSNTFDMILFLDAIEHLKDPVIVLKELARVLKPSAKILICTMNYASPLWFILENTWHRFFGDSCKPYSTDVHPTPYTEKLLRYHCEGLFKESLLEKRVMGMELFFVGVKHHTPA